MKNSKKRGLTVLLIIIGVILALIISFVAIINYYFNKIDYNPENESVVWVDVTHDKDTDGEDTVDVKMEEDNILANLNKEMMEHPDVYNVLLIGRDTTSSNSNGRSDAMVILSINEKLGSVKMVSFQRDMYAFIEGKGFDKLTHAHSYGGAPLCLQTLENNFHVKIDNYISTNFTTFTTLVNIIGGVDLELTKAEANYLKNNLYRQGYNEIQAGTYHTDGLTTLSYARIRYLDSDRGRTQRHRNVINAVFNELSSLTLTKMVSLLDECLPYLSTNIQKLELMELTAKSLNYLKFDRTEFALPLEDASYDATINGMFVITLDWEENVAALQEFLYGDIKAD